MQYTNSGTDEDAANDAYIQLGNVSSVDLVSFAYQIASGMVRKFSTMYIYIKLLCTQVN